MIFVIVEKGVRGGRTLSFDKIIIFPLTCVGRCGIIGIVE